MLIVRIVAFVIGCVLVVKGTYYLRPATCPAQDHDTRGYTYLFLGAIIVILIVLPPSSLWAK